AAACTDAAPVPTTDVPACLAIAGRSYRRGSRGFAGVGSSAGPSLASSMFALELHYTLFITIGPKIPGFGNDTISTLTADPQMADLRFDANSLEIDFHVPTLS